MDTLLTDLRQGLRRLGKERSASAIAIVALTLGIGLTTLMFSIIYGAMLRGLPFEQAPEIVGITRTNPAQGEDDLEVIIHDFVEWRAQQRSFEDIGAFHTTSLNLSGTGEAPERLRAARVTPSTLAILGVQPVLGRLFTEEEDVPGGPPVMLIGWSVWQNRFAGSRDVLGTTVRANGVETEIIGVMPEGFGFPSVQAAWLPLRMDPLQVTRGQARPLDGIGRLRDGVTGDQAQADLAAIADRLARAYPETNQGVSIRLHPFTDRAIGAEERMTLWTMFGAVVFVLLIACTNVANLLMAQAVRRGREVAVRTALGASARRIATQFLSEAMILALVGASAGAVLAAIGIRLFNNAIVDTQPPFWMRFAIDVPALLTALVAALIATAAAGTIPAMRAARARTHEILKDVSRGGTSFRIGRLHRALVGFAMALSVGLLAGAGLMIKSVVQAYNVDLGFPADRILSARVTLPEVTYPDAVSRRSFADGVLRGMAAIPGITAATLGTGAPGLGAGASEFAVEGQTYARDVDYPIATSAMVAAGYFAVFDAPLLRGRDFNVADADGSTRVAIVNQAFANRWFNGDEALGRRIRFIADGEDAWLTIIGVVPDLLASGIEDRRPEAIYRPISQTGPTFLYLLARTQGPPTAVLTDLRTLVGRLDPDLPVDQPDSLRALIRDGNWAYAVFGTIFIAFGLAALFLASVGLYGVMSFAVGQRTREIGVRMAVGARSRDVMGWILRQGIGQTILGLGLGTLFALAVTRLLSVLLFRVNPRDPVIFGTILIVLLSTIFLASWIPARRATRIDPLEALRSE
ncbi:MAG: ABC transporter permease [Gemmatimonadetes bacterium]|nr:ABC transporter permease [Gemmatimonadota bacterium]